jgi:hypothetical protein
MESTGFERSPSQGTSTAAIAVVAAATMMSGSRWLAKTF